MDWALSFITYMITEVFNMFVKAISFLGGWQLLFGAFSLVVGYRFVLMPLLGGNLSIGFNSFLKKRYESMSSSSDSSDTGGTELSTRSEYLHDRVL